MSSRSTVGTATEVYDYLRLLWARIGEPRCVACGGPVARDTPQSAATTILADGEGRLRIAFPLPPGSRRAQAVTVDNLRALGFLRLEVDGTTHHLAELPHLGLTVGRKVELADGGAGEAAPAALGEHHELRLDVGTGLEVAELLPLLAAALVAGAHADDASLLDDQLRGRSRPSMAGARPARSN